MKWIILIASLSLATSVCGSCSNKNPFIGTLINAGVTVFSEPRSSSDKVCSHEWAQHLTCCSASNLVKFAKDQTLKDRQMYQNAKDELNFAARVLTKAVTDFSSLGSSLLQCPSLADIAEDIKTFREAISRFFLNQDKHEVLEEQCYNKNEKIRNRVLCYTCSGRSESFFSGSRARISLDDCKGIIDECAYLWGRAITLVDVIDLADRIIKNLKPFFPDVLGKIDLSAARPLKVWIDSSNLRHTMSLCQNTSAATCDGTSAKSVCENLVNLNDKTFLEKTLSVTKTGLSRFVELGTATETISYRVSEELNNPPNPGGRGIASPLCNPPTQNTPAPTQGQPGSQTYPPSKKPGNWNVGRRILDTLAPNSCGGSSDTQVVTNPPRDCPGCMQVGGSCPECP